jgi:hypothetical protein
MNKQEVLTEANHYNFGDVHPQYVSKSLFKKLPMFTDTSKPYYALTTINIYNKDLSVIYEFDLLDISNGSLGYGKYLIKIDVTASNQKSAYIEKVYTKNIDDVQIKVSCVDNGSNGYVFYVYIVQSAINKNYVYTSTKEYCTRQNRYSYDFAYGAAYRSNASGEILVTS